VDFRLVCATHRDLHAAMAQGLFREDLYYRLDGLALQLPALRERQDQSQLVQRMLREFAPGRELQMAPGLAQALAGYRWPGNLRQLDHALRTACAMLDDEDGCIDWHHLSDELACELRTTAQRPRAADEEADLRTQAARQVRQAVEDCRGNMSQAARRLGISRNTLYRKVRELGA
jgi:transcriptional regulator of acetoin/glycerol metabolism